MSQSLLKSGLMNHDKLLKIEFLEGPLKSQSLLKSGLMNPRMLFFDISLRSKTGRNPFLNQVL